MANTSFKQILQIASLFDIKGEPTNATTFGNGLINDTYRVETSSGNTYVVQRINTAIFKNPDSLQSNLLKISAHMRKLLSESGATDIDRKVLTPVLLKAGGTYAISPIDDSVWRMTEFIPGSHSEENLTPEMARLTGEAFGDFHSYFSHPETPELEETIPNFHNIAFRISQLKEAAAADSAQRLQWVADIVDYLLSREEEMLMANRMHAAGTLPKRIAHCDTKVNNILFDENNQILCVIDLDTTMPGFVMSDFGDFIRTAGNTGAEDDEDLSRVGVNMEIFRNFAEGYLKSAKFLTKEEKETLPFGAKLLTYMQTVRFLTDYLNGDTYYKIAYPEHNLVRTRAQLKLLTEIDAHFSEMQEIINTIN